MMKAFFRFRLLLMLSLLSFLIVCCHAAPAAPKADLVIYGKIFTANSGNEIAEAVAIQGGKYLYVGSRAGVENYLDDKTQVIHHSNGMIMPGAVEGHGYYVSYSTVKLLMTTSADTLKTLKADLKKYIAAHPQKKCYVGVGWSARKNDLVPNADLDFAKEIDEICSDKPVILLDDDSQQCICNTVALKEIFSACGIAYMDTSRTQNDITALLGSVILRSKDGKANGYLRDQIVIAAVKYFAARVASKEDVIWACEDLQQELYRNGYTAALDASTNMVGSDVFQTCRDLDQAGHFKINLFPHYVLRSYELQTPEDIRKNVAKVAQYHQFSSNHVLPCGIKLFADGETEALTGFNDVPYADGSHGNEELTEEQIYMVTREANRIGIPVHIHACGNMGVHQAVNAFARVQQKFNENNEKILHNSIAHVRNVLVSDYPVIAANHIFMVENINCHAGFSQSRTEKLRKYIPPEIFDQGYPIQSFVKNNCLVASSSDAPSAQDFPADIFSIMQIAVAPVVHPWWGGRDNETLVPLNPSEHITIQDALRIMTINGAKLLGIDRERGSIEVGKYADFLLIDQDLLTCPPENIHKTHLGAVYFEGAKVWPK